MPIKQFIFSNAEQKNFFNEKGYLIAPLLNKTEVQKLQSIYNEVQKHLKKNSVNIYTTGEHIEKEIAIQTNNQIQEVINKPVNSVIKDFDTLMAAFIVKPPNQNTEDYFDWHQDLSFVDESKFQSAQVWIALQDTNENNGAIEVIEHSHLYNNFIRTAPWFPSFFENYMPEIVLQKKQINLKAGEMVLFDHRLLHCSPANSTNLERLAVLMSIKVPEADWLYSTYSKDEKKVKIYKADKTFYLDLWIDKKINEDNLLEHYHYDFPHISHQDFQNLYDRNQKISIFD